MSNLSKTSTRTKTIALIAIFSAVYTALRLIPTVPMVGTSATFSLSDILAPLYGILLGPYVGGASIVLGSFAAMGMGKAAPFLGLDFLPALVNAVALGFLVRRKWWPVVALNAALLIAYVLNPLTLNFVNTPIGPLPYVWMHVVAFAVLVSPLGRKAGRWIDTLDSSKITAGFAILAFVGTMMQHLAGGILYETIPAQITHTVLLTAYPGIWTFLFYVYPIERIILVVGAVAVGVPVTRILKKYFIHSEINPASNDPQISA